MMLYNFDLSFWENMDNYAMVLFVLGVILLLFVLISYLTARTEEKKEEAKTIFNYGVPVGVIAIIISLCLYPAAKINMANHAGGKQEINRDAQYQSATAKENCRLCGGSNNLMQFYFGENNVAVLDLNTFNFFRLEINRKEKAGHTNITTSRTQNGEMLNFTINSDRGYADVTISLKDNSRLSLEKLSAHLCTECLTDVMNEYLYKGQQWKFALINFADKKITPLQESVTGFSTGDFLVKCGYEKADNEIDLIVLYSPERYK